MANAETVKQERMHIRLDALSKQKLERAAAYAHKSLSEFVLGPALNAADEVIHDHEILTLNEADWEVFLDALENPPKPGTKLKRAFTEHKKRVRRYGGASLDLVIAPLGKQRNRKTFHCGEPSLPNSTFYKACPVSVRSGLAHCWRHSEV